MPSSTLLDDADAPAPPEQGEVAEKRNVVAKKVKRKVGRSSGKSSSQEQDSLDDQEVIHSLMEESIPPHIIDKMVRKDNAERFDESFATYLELGHYLFFHSKVAYLYQIEASRAL
ncbi:hypothetical protein COCNU_09G001250 [Cocos nucifera]|uniref:Uncharacterized protein n=1 Tax=Cocos nucifera TaxID=13894 RepID=A0A8K0N6C9_COCNU|nr:hypothetical protein COCNU_09G001250 [Cocos nucifera]